VTLDRTGPWRGRWIAPRIRRGGHPLAADREAGLARLWADKPRPKLWRKFETPEFGAGRNVRFGDLAGCVRKYDLAHLGPRLKAT
jgi:hypothetical protein